MHDTRDLRSDGDGRDSTDSPGDATDGIPPDEVFMTLANPIRVRILEVLWESDEESLEFSELRRRVGLADSGQFNFHLRKLTDHFLRQVDGRYALRETGRLAVRLIRGGSLTDDASFEWVELDVACQHCGAPVEVAYADEILTVRCRNAQGHIPGREPTGVLFELTFPAAGIRDRTPAETAEAALIRADLGLQAFEEGVCPTCAGRVESTVLVCESHEGGDGVICPHCDAVYAVWAKHVCANCRDTSWAPAWHRLLRVPAVAAFFEDHGIAMPLMTWELFGFNGYHETVQSVDPLVLEVGIRFPDDELVAVFDGDLAVVSVDR